MSCLGAREQGPGRRVASAVGVKINDILSRIDSGAIALPEFQRGYVWGRRQVRDLVESLYRRFPVGSLLLWETETATAPARGDGPLTPGVVSLLLDGQQRITSLYGLLRDRPPPFFDGDTRAFTELRFNVETASLAFYAPVMMANNPLWVDVSELMQHDAALILDRLMPVLQQDGVFDAERFQRFNRNLTRLYGIRDIEVHSEVITGADKTIDVVVDLFNRVNSGGTKLSKGDLALAKICAAWPPARDELKRSLAKWHDQGYDFSIDWLLRNVSALVNGKAQLTDLAEAPIEDFQRGLQSAERSVDVVLNLTASRLGLDHDRVLGGIGAIPVMTRFVANHGFRLPDSDTADKLLFWYVHALLWGRYAGSTETVLNVDLQLVDPTLAKGQSRRRGTAGEPLDDLIAELTRQRGDLRLHGDDFLGWSKGARFYPLLYMLSRVFHARDLASGHELRQHLLGRHAALEVHHLFPKALLYRHHFERPDVNALANFCFLTLDTNRALGRRAPADYFRECEERHPEVLASQWIPLDSDLWTIERYPDFLAHRRQLLADAANGLLEDLLGGKLEPTGRPDEPVTIVDAEDEAERLADVQEWLSARGLRTGERAFALLGLDGRREDALLDLAWPDGLEHGGDRIALLLDEPPSVRDVAGSHGFRYFTSVEELQDYVETEWPALPA